jgi:hypothetical protein
MKSKESEANPSATAVAVASHDLLSCPVCGHAPHWRKPNDIKNLYPGRHYIACSGIMGKPHKTISMRMWLDTDEEACEEWNKWVSRLDNVYSVEFNNIYLALISM